VTAVVVDPRDHVGREVDDPLEVLRGEVEQVPRRDGTPLKYQMWVTRAASSMWPILSRRTLLRDDLDTAALADDALETDALVLAAVALQSRVGPKNPLGRTGPSLSRA